MKHLKVSPAVYRYETDIPVGGQYYKKVSKFHILLLNKSALPKGSMAISQPKPNKCFLEEKVVIHKRGFTQQDKWCLLDTSKNTWEQAKTQCF